MSAQNHDELIDPPSRKEDRANLAAGPGDRDLPSPEATRIGPSGSGEGPQVASQAAAAPLGALGNYELLTRLGQGGMGTVYKARHTKLERIVALKVLPAGRLQDPQAVARFQREMRAVGKLQHPHIVAAYDAGEIGGTYYLVMELVTGIDLGALARTRGKLPVAEACELIRQAARGLEHAHENGLVHRDVKPSNLMLARAAQPGAPPSLKILDLGLALLEGGQAEAAGELTATGQVMGTIDYMAPEQGSDTHGVDGQADIYSLGATLYRLLTGQAPFAGAQYDTAVKKLMALATKEPPPVAALRPDCPNDLAALVQQMLAKNPAARPASAAAAAQALERFARGADLRTLFDPSAEVESSQPAMEDVAASRNTAASAYDETNIREAAAQSKPAAAGPAGQLAGNPFGIDWSEGLPSSRLLLKHEPLSLQKRLATAAAIVLLISATGAYIFWQARRPQPHLAATVVSNEKPRPEKQSANKPAAAGEHERAAARWVLENGGTVKLDGRNQQIQDAAFLPDRPFQLTSIVIPEGFHGVGLTDALQNLPHVTELAVGGSFFGDAQAAVAADMPELISVSFTHCPVGDDGLKHLVGHAHLAAVGLYYAVNVRDEGLQSLSGLTTLTSVHVGGTQITDGALKHLSRLTRLKYLMADDTRLTGIGFRDLAALEELDYVHLANDPITDEGVAAICGLRALRHLSLENTQITDASLDVLGKHPHLISLHVNGTRLTARGLARLRKALPNCEVRGDPPAPAADQEAGPPK